MIRVVMSVYEFISCPPHVSIQDGETIDKRAMFAMFQGVFHSCTTYSCLVETLGGTRTGTSVSCLDTPVSARTFGLS